MDLDTITDLINERRDRFVRVGTNDGKSIDIPPGAKSYFVGVDTFYIVWPPADPDDPFRVPRVMHIAGVNIATAEMVQTPAA